jgi:hypothetical protein
MDKEAQDAAATWMQQVEFLLAQDDPATWMQPYLIVFNLIDEVFDDYKNRAPKIALLLSLMERFHERLIAAAVQFRAAGDHKTATEMIALAWFANTLIPHLRERYAHRKAGADGGSKPKPVPSWVALAKPVIEKAQAKNPDVSTWAVAGVISRDVRGAPEQQAVFKYIKKHNLLTKL